MIRPLAATDNVAVFDCGDTARNAWLRRRGLENEAAGFSRTFVVLDDLGVAGFYALSATGIMRDLMPGALRRNAPDPIPAVLLGQLGVALRCQRQGVASRLIVDAFARTLRIAETIGVRFLAVTPATPEVAALYRKFGFQVVAGTTPPFMVVTMWQVAGLLGESQ